jgi:hypothetical protein
MLVGVGLATFVFIGWRFYQDWTIIKGVIRRAQYGFLALSFLSLQISLGLFIGGWHLMMGKLADARDLWLNLRLYCLANLGKNLPTPIWYIGGRPSRVSPLETGIPFAAIAVVGAATRERRPGDGPIPR